MPITPTYPGVYIEEIPSGVRTIAGVSTSVTAFIGYFRQGPMNEPVQLFNLGDFEREFGGLDSLSVASYGVQQFFLNGGTEAWVVRTASGGVAAAAVAILDGVTGGATVLTVRAINPGSWGDNLRVSIDYPEPTSGTEFNMTVSLLETRNGEQVVVRSEMFRRLSMTAAATNYVEKVVNDEFSGSTLVQVTAVAGGARPQPTGTLSGDLSAFPASFTTSPGQVDVTIGTEGTGIATLWQTAADQPANLSAARAQLESAIRAARPELKAFSQATVSVVDNRLRILAGPTSADARVTFEASGTDPTVTTLGLMPGTALGAAISADLTGNFPFSGEVEVTIGGAPEIIVLGTTMNNIGDAATQLEAEIRAVVGAPVDFTQARVIAHTDGGVERLIVLSGAAGSTPVFAATGGDPTTVVDLGLDGGVVATSALLSDNITPVPSVAAASAVEVTIGGIGPETATLAGAVADLTLIAADLQTAIRAADPSADVTFTGALVGGWTDGMAENRLVVLPGTPLDAVLFAAAPLDATTVTELLLDAPPAEANVQLYALGVVAAVAETAQGAGTPGNDGTPPDGNALIGDLNAKEGIFALEDVDIFNILCIPRTAIVTGDNPLAAPEASAVMTAAINYCEKRRAFFIVDTPTGVDDVQEIKEWLESVNLPSGRKNAALYFPRVQIPDPLDDFRLRSVGASGTMAGLYARTDGTRGVWKAPAGTEATLANVQQFDYTLSDDENGTLNPLAINCLRAFPVYGNVSWGARTLVGADQLGSEWKYVPVRRVALFIEESLYRGTKWVVFEPNDEPLWAQIRLNVTAFMHRLFRQGAFQGQSPREAYLVKCDAETTPQSDIDLGIVTIVVGFAPLKPAEFVIIQIKQLTKSAVG